LYREIMAVCSEIHTKHINTVCGQNVELLNVKLALYTYSDHWDLGGLIFLTISLQNWDFLFHNCLRFLEDSR
jgi:hypothetical protein